jgi:hypothetical protein
MACLCPSEICKKTEPRFRGSAKLQQKGLRFDYFTCAFSAAMSASLRSVITPILLSR